MKPYSVIDIALEMLLQSINDYAEAPMLDTLAFHSTCASMTLNVEAVPTMATGILTTSPRQKVLSRCTDVLGEAMSTAIFSVVEGTGKHIGAPNVMK
jgi:hypothetical protein